MGPQWWWLIYFPVHVVTPASGRGLPEGKSPILWSDQFRSPLAVQHLRTPLILSYEWWANTRINRIIMACFFLLWEQLNWWKDSCCLQRLHTWASCLQMLSGKGWFPSALFIATDRSQAPLHKEWHSLPFCFWIVCLIRRSSRDPLSSSGDHDFYWELRVVA